PAHPFRSGPVKPDVCRTGQAPEFHDWKATLAAMAVIDLILSLQSIQSNYTEGTMTRKAFLLAALLYGTSSAFAQDYGNDEIMVTAMRREAENYSAEVPAVGLRRTADFAIVEVSITGDSRDSEQR